MAQKESEEFLLTETDFILQFSHTTSTFLFNGAEIYNILDNLASALLKIFCGASSDKILIWFYRNKLDSAPSPYIGHF